MAGGGSALLDDSSAVFASPAMIAFSDASVDLGIIGAVNRLRTRLSPRPDGYDAPDLGSGSPVIPYGYRLNPREMDSGSDGMFGFQVGVINSLGLDWFRLGALVFLPTAGIGNQYTYFADEREQYFSNALQSEFYNKRLNTQQALIVGAVRPFSWLGLSGGIRMAFAVRTDNLVLIPDSEDQSVQYMDLRTETTLDAAPIAGAAVRFWEDKLRVSATYRHPLSSTIRGTNLIQIRGFQGTEDFPLEQVISSTVLFMPRQVAGSVAGRIGPVSLVADLTWNQWSDYLDTHDAIAGFNDTLNYSLGAEVQIAPDAQVRTGVGYRPSPVPPQTGRTNYVDNDMWILGLGATKSFKLMRYELEISAFAQLQAAVDRSTTKTRLAVHPVCAPGVTELCDEVPDSTTAPNSTEPAPEAQGLQTGNPGFPGFSSGGWIGAAGAQITWRYP